MAVQSAHMAVESYHKAVQSYHMAVQEKEKIKTNKDSIVLAVDPRSTEEEIAAERKKILMNLSIENWKE